MRRATLFLALDDVLAIHGRQVQRYGGAHGLRDVGLLQSALGLPQASFAGELLHGSVATQAAAYLFHIVSNHAFVDGNKRVGLAAALVFLRLNGHRLAATEDEVVDLTLRVAAGRATKAEVAVFFEGRVVAAQNVPLQ